MSGKGYAQRLVHGHGLGGGTSRTRRQLETSPDAQRVGPVDEVGALRTPRAPSSANSAYGAARKGWTGDGGMAGRWGALRSWRFAPRSALFLELIEKVICYSCVLQGSNKS